MIGITLARGVVAAIFGIGLCACTVPTTPPATTVPITAPEAVSRSAMTDGRAVSVVVQSTVSVAQATR